ncbi:hypothetical protein PBN151_5277 [Paenibacillus sp. NAIST15-1]|nr:hypothetical protein PBN151_5277 [Paenibacillus sp. NAIST15-1]
MMIEMDATFGRLDKRRTIASRKEVMKLVITVVIFSAVLDKLLLIEP